MQMQQLADRENKTWIKYRYSVGDKILILCKKNDIKSKLECPTQGPYSIVQIFQNGTIEIDHGAYTETINLSRVKPYLERHQE